MSNQNEQQSALMQSLLNRRRVVTAQPMQTMFRPMAPPPQDYTLENQEPRPEWSEIKRRWGFGPKEEEQPQPIVSTGTVTDFQGRPAGTVTVGEMAKNKQPLVGGGGGMIGA